MKTISTLFKTTFGITLSLLLFFLIVLNTKSKAQYTIQRDYSFNVADTIAQRPIDNVAVQPDGKVLLYHNGITQFLYRLNENGSRDTSFYNNLGNLYPDKIAVANSGNIFLSAYNMFPELYKLHPDGSIDSTFYFSDSTVSSVAKIEIQSDEKLIVLYYNNNNRPKIIRLNQNGTIDNSFTIGAPTSGDIYDIKLQNDGNCIVAGNFNNYAGQTAFKRVIRLDANGNIDQTFSVGNMNVYGNLVAIEMQNDGKILLGGKFQVYGPSMAFNGLIRLNTNGGRDTSFTTIPMDFDYDLKIKYLSNGNIMIMGDYGQLGTINNTNYLAVHRLMPDGNVDNSYMGHFVGDIYGFKYDIAATGKIYLGTYTNHTITFNDTLFNFLMGADENGYLNTNFLKGNNSFDKEVRVCKQFQDGNVWIGGKFSYMGNHFSQGIIKLNSMGNVDSSFTPGYGFPSTKYGVMDILELTNNKILVAGQFTEYNETPTQNIIQLNTDGSIDNSFNFNNSIGSYAIQRIIRQPDSKIIAVAYLYASGPIQDYKVIRLNQDGTIDPTFNTGTGFVYNCTTCNALSKHSVQLDNNGKIVVAGAIIEYNGEVVKKILRLNADGSRDTNFAYTFGFNNQVLAIAIQPDNKILAAGLFTEFNNIPVPSIVRLNENGTLDTTFQFPYNSFFSINYSILKFEILPNAKIIISHGENPNWLNFNGLLRLNADGSLDSTFTMQSGFEGGINDFTIMQDQGILVGGYLRAFDQTEFNHLAKLKEIQPTIVSNFSSASNPSTNTIFPNPCSDKLFLVDNEIAKYTIYDMQGRVISKGMTQKTIDVSELENGIYVIELTARTNKTNTKFIKH
jgi:uncharacterized delta-60 repeat protein